MIELRWYDTVTMKAHNKPTATDAIEYANDRLKADKEMKCCKTDERLKEFVNVSQLLMGIK